MANVTQYHVLVYGSPDGYQGLRAQITPYDGGNVLGYIRFHDPGMPFPTDSVDGGGRILMHQPSANFINVLDLLRNEKPITYYFAAGRAFLGTGSTEPVGEGEA